MDAENLFAAERTLGYSFKDRALLERAITHASLVESRLDSNERLEFLGDAVLGMVICEHLFANYDHLLEGEMTKIKSSVVSRQSCATVADDLGLADLLRLGKGMSNRSALPNSIVSALFESLIGAIYLDGGLELAKEFVLRHMEPRVERTARSGHQYNFKSVLQQFVQQQFEVSPQYLVLDEQGPDHAKCFEICVEIGARRFNSSWGPSKKQAEQKAALEALLDLGYAERTDGGDIRLLDHENQQLEMTD